MEPSKRHVQLAIQACAEAGLESTDSRLIAAIARKIADEAAELDSRQRTLGAIVRHCVSLTGDPPACKACSSNDPDKCPVMRFLLKEDT